MEIFIDTKLEGGLFVKKIDNICIIYISYMCNMMFNNLR